MCQEHIRADKQYIRRPTICRPSCPPLPSPTPASSGPRGTRPPETMPAMAPSDIMRCRLAASPSASCAPPSAAPRLRGGLRSGDGCRPRRGGDASPRGCWPLRGGLASSGLSCRRLLGGEASELQCRGMLLEVRRRCNRLLMKIMYMSGGMVPCTGCYHGCGASVAKRPSCAMSNTIWCVWGVGGWGGGVGWGVRWQHCRPSKCGAGSMGPRKCPKTEAWYLLRHLQKPSQLHVCPRHRKRPGKCKAASRTANNSSTLHMRCPICSPSK